MRYAVWNNKGGVGKTFLSFVLGAEIAEKTKQPVLLVDMCPQANLSEIVLGGNGIGAERLEKLIANRQTVGGYFDSRIKSPHTKTGSEADFLIEARPINDNLPRNLWIIAGDPSLEIQAQVINQIGGQALPVDAWRNVHNWLKDLVDECTVRLGVDSTVVLIDCNPSFSAYTELAMFAAEHVMIPCSSDGSSARAIDNVGSLLFGVGRGSDYGDAGFAAKAKQFGMNVPMIHSVLLNRSTQYSQKASKAFRAMYDEIKRRVEDLQKAVPGQFDDDGPAFADIPDSHSVAIVCSHRGRPLYSLSPGQYEVHDTKPQVNNEPLDRYKAAMANLLDQLLEPA